jgi:DNA-binding HxlR family transcriptional regulator
MLIKNKVKATKRSYSQFCAIAKALDVVGERWTLLIVRNLLVGGQRYKDLLATLPGITTNLLAARLRELSAAGLIAQRTLPAPSSAVVYELTPAGRELEPVVLALGRFGARYLASKKRGDRTHVRWAMVSLKRRYRGSAHPGTVALEVDGEHAYRLRLGPDALAIDEGPAQSGDQVRVRLDAASLRALLFEGAAASALVASRAIALEGSGEVFFELVRAVGAVV